MSSKVVEPTQKTISQPPPPSLSSLPDEIIENIIARVSKWSYPSLSLVSKKFYSLLSSKQIYKTRSHIGAQETCVYVCLKLPNHPNPSWFCLWTKPNQTPKRRRGSSVVPTPFSSSHDFPIPNVIVNGSEIYVIGGPEDAPSSSVRILDCRSHTWREASDMTVAREDPCVVLCNEKIYVMGGCSIDEYSASWFEIFDIKTQSWTALPSPQANEDKLRNHLRVNYTYSVDYVFEGKLYVSTNGGDYTHDTNDGTWKFVRDQSESNDLWLENENILYGYNKSGYIMWSDSFFVNEGRQWREIKGLEKLYQHHTRALNYENVIYMQYFDEKLVVMWDPYTSDRRIKRKNRIWYAKISLESRSSSCNGCELWGKVECVDVLKFPCESYDFFGCYVVLV